jgi:hypothetical protein
MRRRITRTHWQIHLVTIHLSSLDITVADARVVKGREGIPPRQLYRKMPSASRIW